MRDPGRAAAGDPALTRESLSGTGMTGKLLYACTCNLKFLSSSGILYPWTGLGATTSANWGPINLDYWFYHPIICNYLELLQLFVCKKCYFYLQLLHQVAKQ